MMYWIQLNMINLVWWNKSSLKILYVSVCFFAKMHAISWKTRKSIKTLVREVPCTMDNRKLYHFHSAKQQKSYNWEISNEICVFLCIKKHQYRLKTWMKLNRTWQIRDKIRDCDEIEERKNAYNFLGDSIWFIVIKGVAQKSSHKNRKSFQKYIQTIED